jgi:hypothetical protein
MKSGVRGTFVTAVTSSTSLTFAISKANISSPSLKVKYCLAFDSAVIAMTASCHDQQPGASIQEPEESQSS